MSRRRPAGPYPFARRSVIDEDNDRERDIALRPARASGGPFPLRELDDEDKSVISALSDPVGGYVDVSRGSAAESSPRHPDPRCYECGERLADADRAEVFLTGRAESAWSYGPFLVHADPCYTANKEKYDLA